MMRPLSLMILLLTSIFLVACGDQTANLGCENTSLRKDCVTPMAKSLDAPVYSQKPAFESKKLERSYPNAPPQIPHDINGVDITADFNSCLGCHFPGGGPVPALPKSHRMVPKIVVNQTQKPQTTKVKGYRTTSKPDQARYFCTQCHVPQASNLKPLVENQF